MALPKALAASAKQGEAPSLAPQKTAIRLNLLLLLTSFAAEQGACTPVPSMTAVFSVPGVQGSLRAAVAIVGDDNNSLTFELPGL